ncbi:tyrosine-type recombinase/integrase [Herminiimonas arsenitoxidans]|uniref:tyrosine-type recombinase/integrase n=1 Tax=Herminiimonas arsenitoxidans TaxID=1809410 RepID=UPI0009712E47|nr:tyrosine-type recombinase/integrase [Herminiimonas arsenitoxidans]
MNKNLIHHLGRSKWVLKPNELFDGETHSVNWQDLFQDEIGTKYQREYLRKSCKGLLMAMILMPRITRGLSVSSGTVCNWFFHISRLVHWMTSRDIWRFGQLSSQDLMDYIAYSPSPESKKKSSSISSHKAYKNLFQQMWSLRNEYTSPLKIDPAILPLDSIVPIRQAMPWKALDESVALPLIKDSIQWASEYGWYLVNISDQVSAKVKRHVGISNAKKNAAKRTVFSSFDSDQKFDNLRSQLKMEEKAAKFVFEKACRTLEGACLIIILFLVGMRLREITRLNVGCLLEKKDSFGDVSYYLKGIAAKNDGRERTWAITESVVTVINLLENMNKSKRKSGSESALLVSTKNACMAGNLQKKIRRFNPALVKKRINDFARAPFREKMSESVRLHPHAARKTFARFVVLRDKRTLEALSHHFGHVHRAVTDGAYVGSDIELEKLISEEGRKDLVAGLMDILSSTNIGGGASQALKGIYGERSGASFRGRKTLDSIVDELIEKGVKLAPCDWGYCVYSQALSACRGSEKEPNPVQRSPEVCSTCSNFVVTEKHRSWWESRYLREEDFLGNDALPEQTREIAIQRFSKTKQVLSNLNKSKFSEKKPSVESQNEK